MNNLSAPLTDKELEQLDHFLFYRFDNEDDDLDKDEGVICLSELDGFLPQLSVAP